MIAATDRVARLARYRDELDASGALPNGDELVAVLLVGSQARGWANPTSDYDFCVVTRTPYPAAAGLAVSVPLMPPAVVTRELALSDAHCELAYWTEGQIEQMLAKVAWDRFEARGSSLKSLVEVEETLLERLATAIPLVGDDWLEARQRAVAESAFRPFITTFSLSSADGKIEDIAGMIEAGDAESAVLAARLALDHMVDALLDSRGVYGSRIPKWRMRRLRELPDAALPADRYWELTTMATFDSSDPLAWVHEVVAECQALSLEIEI